MFSENAQCRSRAGARKAVVHRFLLENEQSMKRLVILSLLLCGVASAAPDSPQWKVIKTKYPTTDTVIAGYNVLDFGAVGDGKTDCTRAFQQALDGMASAGGGTVFVPEGFYAIKETLQIPTSVTLRGEWAVPTAKSAAVKGTVLMAYAGRGETNGVPFITVSQCAGIKDLSIWYPEQSAQDIVAYPYCLIQKDGDNSTFENLTLVNPYLGIRVGPGRNEMHFAHNVYGTPLSVGIRYDMTTDIGRLENLHFSPDYWCQSGLSNAPAAKGPLAAWLLANGTAIYMERSDWEYVAYVFIDGDRAFASAPHALADEKCRVRLMFLSRRFQRFPMRCDELRQRIGPFAARAHVIVVESLDLTDPGQTPFPILHPRMRRRRTGPWSKKNQTPAHGSFLCKGSVQHRCRFNLYQKFWNCQGRDADPGTCRRILRRKEFS